jgi:hypothetical protein
MKTLKNKTVVRLQHFVRGIIDTESNFSQFVIKREKKNIPALFSG